MRKSSPLLRWFRAHVRVPCVALLLLCFSTWTVQVKGATGFWTADAAGNWSVTTNWQSGLVPNAIGDVAVFNNDIGGGRTITLNVPVTLGGLSINDRLGGSVFTFAGTNSLTFDNGGSNAFVNKFGSATDVWQAPLVLTSNVDFNIHSGVLQVNGVSNAQVAITGGGNMIKNGAGTLQVNGNLSGYTGNYIVNLGTLALGGANAAAVDLGTGTGGFTLNGSGSADRTILQLRNNGTGSNGTVTYLNNNDVTVQGAVTINVDQNFISPGNTGNTIVLDNLTMNGGLLQVTGGNSYGLRIDGTTTLVGQNNVFSPATAASPFTLNGVITDGANSRALVKEGAGRLVVANAANTFDGVTAVKDGILQVKAGANLGGGTTFVNGGALSPANKATLDAVAANGLALVGQLGTSRYAVPAIGFLQTYGNIDNTNPVSVAVPLAGLALAIDGGETNATVTANIDLSQVGTGSYSNRVWVTNALGIDRTYQGVITPSADNVIRLASGGNTLLISGSANRLGGAGSTAGLMFGYDHTTPINIATTTAVTQVQGGTISVRTDNDTTGAVTIHRAATVNVNGAGLTKPLGTGAVTMLGGTLNTDGTNDVKLGNTDFRLYGGSTLLLDNSAVTTGNTNRRLDPSTAIRLTSSTLRLLGDGGAATSSSQAIGQLTYAGGSTVSVDTDGTTGARLTTLTASSLNRIERGTLNIRNTANNTSTFGTASGTQKLIVTTAPTVTNGMIGADIVLWGGTTSNDAGTPLFATYDGTHGIQAATLTAITAAANLASSPATQVTTIDATAIAVTGSPSLQALRIRSTSSGNTLTSGTVTLGASAAAGQGAGLFLSHTSNDTITHTTNFTFGNNQEGLVYVMTNGSSSAVALSGVIAGSNGVTRFGNGLLRLSGANTFTGPLTLNAGETRLNHIAGASGTATAPNAINLYGGSLYLEASGARYYANVNVYDNARIGNVNVSSTGFNNLTIQPRTGGSSDPVVLWVQAQAGSNATAAYGSLTLNGPLQLLTPHVFQVNGGITGSERLDKYFNERLILAGDASGYSGTINAYTSAIVSYNGLSTAKPFGTGSVMIHPGAGLTLAAPTNVNPAQVTINSDYGGLSYIGQLYVADPATTLPAFNMNSTAPWKGGFAVGAVGFNADINQSSLFGGDVYLGGAVGYTGIYTGNVTPAAAGYLLGASQGTLRFARPLTGTANAIIGVSMTGDSSRADQTVNNSGGTVQFDVPMSYSGNTILNPGPALRVSARNALTATGDLIFAGGQLRVDANGGQNRMIAPISISNNIVMTADSLIQMENSAYDMRLAGNLALGPGSTGMVRTLTIGSDQPGGAANNAGMVYLDGGISDGAGGSMNHFVKSGTGTLFFTGNNTYTGSTTITGGLIGVNRDADWGATSLINMVNGGIAVWEDSFTTARNYHVHGSNGYFDIASGLTLTQGTTSVIDGGNSLMKRGLGTLVLNGTNAISGIFLADGVLQINSQASMGDPASTSAFSFGSDQGIGGSTANTRYTGGTVRINFTGTTNRGATFNNNGNTNFSGGIDITAGNTFTMTGVIGQGTEFDYGFKTGPGTLVTTANNTWRQFAMTNGILQFGTSTPWLNSTTTAADNTFIEMIGGTIRAINTTANIALTNQASTTLYNYGGGMHLRMGSGAGFSAEFAADNLIRQNQGTLVVETEGATTLGGAGATNAGRVVVTNAIGSVIPRASALNNGIFAPHLLGADAAGTAFFLDNDVTNGFKPYAGATNSTLAGAAPTAIGNITSAQALSGPNSIYAFRTTADVTGGTLTLPSVNMLNMGGIVLNGSNTISSNLVFNPANPASATSLTGASTTANSTAVTVASTAGLVPGMAIFGTNILPGATIVSVNSATSVTISSAATAGGSSLTLSAQQGSAAASGEALVYVKAGENAVISGNVTSNLFTKFGAGVLTLSGGSNMVTSEVSVQEGTLRLGSAGALSRLNSELNINAGATLDLNGNHAAVESVGGNNRQVATAAIGGTVTNTSGTTSTLAVVGPISSSLNGVLSLNMKLLKAGAGVLTINGYSASTPDSGNNTFTGGTDIYGSTAASITNGGTTNGSATVTVPTTQGLTAGMIISGTGIPTNSYITAILSPTSFSISQNATATNTGLTFTSFGGLTVNNNNFGLGGYNGATPGDVNLYSGNLNLFFSNGTTGINSTQGQNFNNQVLKLGADGTDGLTLNVRGPGTIYVNEGLVSSNGTFGQGNIIQVGALNMTNTTLTIGGGNLYRFRAAGPISILGSQAAFQTNQNDGPSGAIELTGVISGAGAITKLGDGLLRGIVITNPANTYSGGTHIVAGDVQVTATSGSALGTGPICVFPDGTLRIAGTGSIDGTKLSTMSRVSALGAVVLDGNFDPSSLLNGTNFSSVYNTALQLGEPYFTQPLNMAGIGDGRAFLGAGLNAEVAYVAPTLGAGVADAWNPGVGVYRIAPGANSFTFSGVDNVLTGNTYLQAGPQRQNVLGAITNGGSVLVIRNSNNFTGGTQITKGTSIYTEIGGKATGETPLGTGAVEVYGELRARGAQGSFFNASTSLHNNAINLRPGGTIRLHDAEGTVALNFLGAGNQGRWGDSVGIDLNGGNFIYNGPVLMQGVEVIGDVTARKAGQLQVFRNSTSSSAQLTVGDISRAERGILTLQYNSGFLGIPATTPLSYERIVATTISGAPISRSGTTTNGAGVVNGGMVAPWIIDRTTNSFVGYDPTAATGTGFQPLLSAAPGAGQISYNQIVTGATFGSGIAANDIADLTTAAKTLNANPTLHALRISAQNLSPTATFNTVTLNSGGLIMTGGTINPTGAITAGVVSPMTLNFGASGAGEAFIYNSGTAIIQAQMKATLGLTKFGAGQLQIHSINPDIGSDVVLHEGTTYIRVPYSLTGSAVGEVLNGQNIIVNGGTLNLQSYNANAAGTATEIASSVQSSQATFGSDIFIRGDSVIRNNGQPQYVRISDLTIANSAGATAMNGNSSITLELQSGLWVNGVTTLGQEARINGTVSGFSQSTLAGQVVGAGGIIKYGNGATTLLGGTNTYAGGTTIWGTTNGTAVSTVASAFRGTGAPFSTGDINIQPGGLLRVADNANIAGNAVYLRSDGYGLGGIGLAHNGVLPAIVTAGVPAAGQIKVESTGPFDGVLALDYGYYSRELNPATIAGGNWWVGNSQQAEAFYFNDAIGASANNKYLLGGGGNLSGVIFGGVAVSGNRAALFENLFAGGSAGSVRMEIGAQAGDFAWNSPSFVNGNTGFITLLTRNTGLVGDVRVNTNSVISLGNNFALGTGRLVFNGGTLRYDIGSTSFGNTNNFVTNSITLDNDIVLQGDLLTSSGNELVLNGNVAMSDVLAAGATRTWTLGGSGSMAVGLTASSTTNGVISGAAGSNIIKAGAQQVAFRGANTYQGYTQINAGSIVAVGNVAPNIAGPLGISDSPITLSGGSVAIGGKFTISRDIILNNNGTIDVRTNETGVVTGGISIATGVTATIGGLGNGNATGVGGTLEIRGPISGGGAVTYGTASASPNANGPVSLIGTSNGYGINTYAGGTTFNSTRVEIGGDTYFTGPAVNPVIISGPFGTGALTLTSGEGGNGAAFLAVGGPRTIVNPFNATSSAANSIFKFMGSQGLTFTRDWNINSDSTLRDRTFQVSNPYQPVTFTGVLSATGTAGANLIKTGSGMLILSGVNTFATSTTTGVRIDDGILRITGDAALGAAGNVRLNGGNLSISSGFSTARGFVLQSSNGGIDVATGQTLTLTLATTGAFGIRKVGPGTLALNNAANTITALTLGGAQQLNPNVGFFSHTGGTVSTTATSGTPFATTSATLNSGTLSLVGGGVAQALTIPTVNYGASGAIALSAGGTSSTLTVATTFARQGAFNTVNYGTLTINPSALVNLGSTEKVLVTAGPPTNTTTAGGDILTVPSIFVRLAAANSDANFARYDAANGIVVHNVATVSTLGASSSANVADITAVDIAGAGNIDIQAVRTSANIAPTDGTTLVRIGRGGLILNGAATVSAAVLFGTGTGASLTEAIVYGREDGSNAAVINGGIAARDFTKTGPGIVELGGIANSLNSNAARLPVLSVQEGILRFANASAQFTNLNRPAPVNAALGSYVLNVNEGGVFDLNGIDTTVVGGLSGNGTVTNNGGASGSLVVQNGFGVDPTFSGLISNGTGTVTLTKRGNGILNLNGHGSYTGGTIVEAGRVTNATGSTVALGRLDVQTVTALGTGPITLSGGDLRLNGAALLDGTLTTNEVVDGIDVLLWGGPNGYDITVASTAATNGVALPANTTSVLRAVTQNAAINNLTIDAPILTSTEGLVFVTGATTFSLDDTVLRIAGGRLFLQGQINAAGKTITKTGASDIVISHTESGAAQNNVGLWKVYGGILNPRSATGAANPLGINPTVELNGGSTSNGLLLTTDGDGTAASERVTTYANTTIRFGSPLPVSSSQFVSSGASRLATDRLLTNNDDKTLVLSSVEVRGALGSAFSYFLNTNSSSLWIDGGTSFERDWSFQADGTATTFNGVISGNGTLSRRSNGATVYFNSENTYNGGTFFTGSGRNLFGSFEGNQVTLSNTAKLGTGHVFLGPLATFQINDAGNLRAGQNIYASGNLNFVSTFSLAADLTLDQIRLRALGLGGIQNNPVDYYLSAVNPSSAVLALGTVYHQALDMRSLGDGMWFLGSATNQVGANGSYDAATLAAGRGDVFRLGAGSATLFFGSNGNSNILADVDASKSSSLIVGAPMTVQSGSSWSSGTVVLLQNQNFTGATTINRGSVLDFRGTLTTSGMEVYGTVNAAGEAGTFINPNTSANIPVTLRPGSTVRFDNTSAGVLPLSATQGRWADATPFNLSNSILRLQGNPAVEVVETVGVINATAGTNQIQIARGVIGRGTELRTPSINRMGNSTVQFSHNGSQLGSDERVILTGAAPVVTNSMVAPWMVSASDVQFITYNADTGFTIAGFDRAQAAATLAATVSAPNDRTVFSGNVVLNTGIDFETYALRLDGNVTLGAAADNTAQLIIGSGGLISNSTRSITAGIVAGSIISPSELLLYNNGTATIGDFSNPNTAGQVLASSITKFGAGLLQFQGNNAGFSGNIRVQQGTVELNYRNTADVTGSVTTTIGGAGGNVIFEGAGTTLNLLAGQGNTSGTNFTGPTVSFDKGVVLGDFVPVASIFVDRSTGSASTAIQSKTVILNGGITFGQGNGDVGQMLRVDLRNIYNLAVHGTTTLNGRSSIAAEDASYGSTAASTLFLRGKVTGTGTLIKGPSDSKSRNMELGYINGLNDYTDGSFLLGGTLRVLARSTNVAANTNTNLVAGGLGNGDITLMQGTLDLRLDDAVTGVADTDIEFVRYTSGAGVGPNLFVNGSTTINADRNFYTGTYTRSGGVVTAVLPGGHGFVNGQSISVTTGANTGSFTITSVTGNTITYADATGTATVGNFVANNNTGSSKMITFNNLTIGSQILTLTAGNSYGFAVGGTTTLLGNAYINNGAELVLGGSAGASGIANSIFTDGGGIILNKVGTSTLWIHSKNDNLAANVYINAGLLAFGNRSVGNNTATLGSGDIFVNPGAAIQVRATTNINTGLGQQVVLTGTPYSPAIFRSVGAFTQANYISMLQPTTPTSNEVAYLAFEGSLPAENFDQSAIGNGRMYFGAISADRTYAGAATGSALLPGLSNLPNSVIGGTSTNPVYRLGGGDTTARTLIINLTAAGAGLGDVGGPTDVQIGSLATLGANGNYITGFVYFQDQNTYTGQTTIARGMTLRFNTAMATGDAAGPLGLNVTEPIHVYGGIRTDSGGSFRNNAGTGQFYTNIMLHPTSTLTFQDMAASGNRWDDDTAINLDGSAIVAEAVNNTDNGSETVGAITFDRGSRIGLTTEGTGDAFLTAASITRASATPNAPGTGRGTMVFAPTSTTTFGAAATTGVAQSQMKFTTAPTASSTSAVSGMLPGYYMESNGNRFVKNGANGITPVVDGDMVAFSSGMTAGTAVVNVTASINLPDFNPVIYALRGGAFTLSSPTGANNDATITFAGSGADVGAVASSGAFVINPNLKFGLDGTNEALFYAGATLTVNGNITAGSITKFGVGGTLVITNDQSDAARGTGNGYSGGWVVNEGNLQFSQFGSGGNAVAGNTIVLNGAQAGSASLTLRAAPTDTLLNYAYTSGTIYAVDNATIDWDAGASDRVHSIANLEIQQSGGIGNTAINGNLDALLRVAVGQSRSILSAGTLTVASNAIVNVDTTATIANFAATNSNAGYLTNSISSGLSVASLVGTNRLTKWGDGTLYVRGDSSATFFGDMVIDQGAVFVTDNGSLGVGALTVNRYGTLEIGVANYVPTNSSLTYNEGSIERWSVDNARSGVLDLGKATLQVAANQPTTSASITLNGGGIQAYVNADGHSNAQASGGVLRILTPTVTFTLAADSFLGDRYYEGANGLDSGKQTHDYKPMEEYVASGAILEVQGVIGGAGGLSKVGFDTVILSGKNTYAGATAVTGGKLMIGTDDALPVTTALSTTANGVLDLNGQNQTVGVLTNPVTTTAVNVTSGFITNSATTTNTLTVGNGAASAFTYSGVIQHNVALTKTGSAAMTLHNANTYTGATTVGGGTLALGLNASIHDSPWINIAGAAAIFDVSAKPAGYTFDGRVSGGGTDTAGKTFATVANAARISGKLIIGDHQGEISGIGSMAPGANSVPGAIATAGDQIGHVYTSSDLTLSGPLTGTLATPETRLTLQLNGATTNIMDLGFAIGSNLGDFLDTNPDYLNGTSGNLAVHDYVNVGGELALNQYGRIGVDFYGSYTPGFGDLFNLLDWSTIVTNGFDAGPTQRTGGESGYDLNLPALNSGMLWDTSRFLSAGVIIVVPEPSRLLLLFFGLLGVFFRRRRTA